MEPMLIKVQPRSFRVLLTTFLLPRASSIQTQVALLRITVSVLEMSRVELGFCLGQRVTKSQLQSQHEYSLATLCTSARAT